MNMAIDMVNTVLKGESFLFAEDELSVFHAYTSLSCMSSLYFNV